MSRYKSIIAAVFCLLLLTGCGRPQLPETIEKTTMSVDEEGNITTWLVESFDKEYYDLEELKTMVVEDAAAYNTKAGETVPIEVQGVEMLGSDKVKVTYRYNGGESYALHTEGVLFYGTVSEAMKAGYALDKVDFRDAEDQSDVEDEDLIADSLEKHVLITDMKAAVYCPYKVTHVSIGAVCGEDGGVDTSQATGNVFILMKK